MPGENATMDIELIVPIAMSEVSYMYACAYVMSHINRIIILKNFTKFFVCVMYVLCMW